jgi:hypothetical protein
MNKKILLSSIGAFALAGAFAHGQILYAQPFNYDAANDGDGLNTNFSSDGWLTSDTLGGFLSGLYTYNHGGGLSYAGLAPSASGGAATYAADSASGSGRYVAQTMDGDLATWHGRDAGTIIGFTGLVNVADNAGLDTNTNVSTLNFLSGEQVNNVTFGVTSERMFVDINENNSLTRIMGPTYTLGETLAFHVQATRGDDTTGDGNGTRPNSPRDSVISIWFNPDFDDLGVPDHIATGSRIGRSTAGFGEVGDRVDYEHMQIRTWQTANNVGVTWDEATMYIIPEPSTYAALIGLLALGLVAYRRRRR